MLGVDYRMPLSSTNTSRPGRPSSACASRMPDTVPTRAIVEHGVEISWDGGQSWTSGPRPL